MTMLLLESRVTAETTALPVAVVSLTMARTPVNSEASLMAAALAMAEEVAWLVDSVSSLATVARRETPLMAI